jgi:hypothetical protein
MGQLFGSELRKQIGLISINESIASSMNSIATGELDLEQLRQRLRKMNDAELLRFGQAAKYMCSPERPFGLRC